MSAAALLTALSWLWLLLSGLLLTAALAALLATLVLAALILLAIVVLVVAHAILLIMDDMGASTAKAKRFLD